jgi:hypothetical protein
MKKLDWIIMCSLLFLPSFLWAGEKWNLTEKTNLISANGSCLGKQVRIDLFSATEKNPIYTSGVACVEGKFQFSDNLLQWESLGDGEYSLVVGGDRDGVKKVMVERPVSQINISDTSENNSKDEKIDPGTPEKSTFLDAFVALQKNIFEMKELLEETDYPEIIKLSLESTLDGMDIAIGKITELIFSSQEDMIKAENDENIEEPIADSIKAEDVPVAENKVEILDDDGALLEESEQVKIENGSDEVIVSDDMISSEGGLEVNSDLISEEE